MTSPMADYNLAQGDLIPVRQAYQHELARRSPLYWLRNLTGTYDEQDYGDRVEEISCKPFPDLEYLDPIAEYWIAAAPGGPPFSKYPVIFVEKSRTMLVSWLAVGLMTHLAQFYPSKGCLLQSKELGTTENEDALKLRKYGKTLYDNQPDWMKVLHPLRSYKRHEDPRTTLRWANGSYILSIPEGADQVNSAHPSAVLMDEAAYQTEGEAAYGSALSTRAKVLAISSAHPSWFYRMTWPERFQPHKLERLSEGLWLHWIKDGTIPVFRIHYTADPLRRNPVWAVSARKFYPTTAAWRKDQEIDYEALSGTYVFQDYEGYKQHIVIDPFEVSDDWPLWFSLDWGGRNPTSVHCYTRSPAGDIYAIWEHYIPGVQQPFQHARAIKDSPYWQRFQAGRKPFFADPSIYNRSQLHASHLSDAMAPRSIAELFAAEGIILTSAYGGRSDQNLTLEILNLWREPKNPKFKIFKNCYYLAWELFSLRHPELKSSQVESKNLPEGIVQKDNHAWDDLKYFLLSIRRAPIGPEQPLDPRVLALAHAYETGTLDINSACYWQRVYEARQETESVGFPLGASRRAIQQRMHW